MVQRLTYRRRHCYATLTNKYRKVKTPGGVLSLQYTTKKANISRCGDCGSALQGIPAMRPKALRTLKQRERTVARAYGGSRCSQCVKDRIKRAFLIEEQKIVKALSKKSKGKKVSAQ